MFTGFSGRCVVQPLTTMHCFRDRTDAERAQKISMADEISVLDNR